MCGYWHMVEVNGIKMARLSFYTFYLGCHKIIQKLSAKRFHVTVSVMYNFIALTFHVLGY